MNRFLIHRMGPDGAVKTWFFNEPVTALSLTDHPDELLVALGSRLIWWCPKNDARRDHGFQLTSWPEARLNDGRAAPNGDFWIGSMGNNVGPHGEPGESKPGQGELFRVRRDAPVKTFKSGLGISNTVCWSPDARTFYFGDTHSNIIWAYDYDVETGDISNQRPFLAGFARGLPDGSAVDGQGYLWNCRFGGSCIVRVHPDGTIDRLIEMPVLNITTCTFGGPHLSTLFITTASMMSSESDRLGGSLFSLRVEVPGLDEFRARV